MKKNKLIAIIPARGGSKRLPNKNSTLLGNIPLIVHSINYAKKNSITKIVVSTDDANIKEIALNFGVEVIDRPYHLSGDEATTVSALKHVLESINEDFDTVVLLQPTNPLRPIALMKNALRKFAEGNYESLMTVTRNYQKFGKVIHDKFEPYNYKIGQRSQDLEPLYFENGLLYITKVKHILNNQIITANAYPMFINHPFASIDIDTQEDFDLAEFMFKKYKNE